MELNNSNADQISVTSMEHTSNVKSSESTQVTTASVEPGNVASAMNSDAEDPNAEDPDAKEPVAEDPDAEDPDEDPVAEDADADDSDAKDPDAEEPDAEDPEAECSNAKAAEVGERQWKDLKDMDFKELCDYIDYQCSKEDVVVNRADYAALPEPVDLALSEAGGNVEDPNVGNEACAFPNSILTDRQWNTVKAMNDVKDLNYMELRECFNLVSDGCLILTAPSRELRTQLVSQPFISQPFREHEGEGPRHWMRQLREETAPIKTEVDELLRGEIPVHPRNPPVNIGGSGPISVETPIENNDKKEGIVNPTKVTPGNPTVEVFPINNFLFVAAEYVPEPTEHDVDEAGLPRTPQTVFPEFAIELATPAEARLISVELTAAIENFWNTRIAEGRPVETFARDFFDFLADYEQGDVFNMGLYCL